MKIQWQVTAGVVALGLWAGSAYSQSAPLTIHGSPPIPNGMVGHAVLPGHPTPETLATGWNERHCNYLEWYNSGSYEYIYVINWEGDSIYAVVSSGSGANPAGVTMEKLCSEKATYFAYFNGSYVTEMLTPYP